MCLKWNEFEANIGVAFGQLRDDFNDVILACEEGQVEAHKVILSACSPFFRSVLRRNPHQKPLLYLKDVKIHHLLSLLSFMYHGQVEMPQDDINSFLALANELEVKGLTEDTGQRGDAEVTGVTDYGTKSGGGGDKTDERKVEEVEKDVVKEVVNNNVTEGEGDTQDVNKVEGEEGEMDPVDLLVEAKLSEEINSEGKKVWRCKDCNHTRTSKYDVGRHAEQHLNLNLSCPLCGTTFHRRDKLRQHLSKIHHITS